MKRPFGNLPLLLCLSAVTSPLTGQAGPTETIDIRVSEGTELGFDVSADGRWIVFDLLGQLWLVPARGGDARPITDGVRDVAEDLDPTFSPDGRQVVFRGERNGRTGLWVVAVAGGAPHQLSQVTDPDAFEGNAAWSPDGKTIAFARVRPGDPPGGRWQSVIAMIDVATGSLRELRVEGVPGSALRDPGWSSDGRIAMVGRDARRNQGGRVYTADPSGGTATPVTTDSSPVLAPAFSPDGRQMAYLAPDSMGRTQVWLWEISASLTAIGSPVRVTNHEDVAPTRVRWKPDGTGLIYSADGRLWTLAVKDRRETEIRFSARLRFARPRPAHLSARIAPAGQPQAARGFMGLALSPDGSRIGVLALGKLWIIPVGGTPRALTDVPLSARHLAWAADGKEVAWSAGAWDEEDLFVTSLTTGATRQLTALPGRAIVPAFSPDGKQLAFIHVQEEPLLRLANIPASPVKDTSQTRNLGPVEVDWTGSSGIAPQWSPRSDGLLATYDINPGEPGLGIISLTGERRAVPQAPDSPIFLQWTSNRILFLRHDRLWQTQFDSSGALAPAVPVGNAPALYATASHDGTALFISDSGLRLVRPDGSGQQLGWPLTYTAPVAPPLLIRGVRIIDGSGAVATTPRDVLIRQGRILRIAPAGTLSDTGARTLEAEGRFLIPGLIELHAHTYRPDRLPGFLYFGITGVRDQGSSMAPLVAHADAIAAGVLPGPRVWYGGFQFYSDWGFDEEQGRGIEPEADLEHVARAVALARAFGAQHIKTRTFRRWDINVRMIAEAHRRGLRATGHCAHQLPLVAVGIEAKEHIGLCSSRSSGAAYDDIVQLFRAANIGVVPTISYLAFAARLNERPALLDDDAELKPFLLPKEDFEWMLQLTPLARAAIVREAQMSRETTRRLSRAGVTVGVGTDIWQSPAGVHMELEEMVAAGLTPGEALRAATLGGATILGAEAELGTIEVGKVADLVLLDADPLADMRNTRRIWQVIQNGQLVDRAAIASISTSH